MLKMIKNSDDFYDFIAHNKKVSNNIKNNLDIITCAIECNSNNITHIHDDCELEHNYVFDVFKKELYYSGKFNEQSQKRTAFYANYITLPHKYRNNTRFVLDMIALDDRILCYQPPCTYKNREFMLLAMRMNRETASYLSNDIKYDVLFTNLIRNCGTCFGIVGENNSISDEEIKISDDLQQLLLNQQDKEQNKEHNKKHDKKEKII